MSKSSLEADLSRLSEVAAQKREMLRFSDGMVRCSGYVRMPLWLLDLDAEDRFQKIEDIRNVWVGESMVVEESLKEDTTPALKIVFEADGFDHVKELRKLKQSLNDLNLVECVIIGVMIEAPYSPTMEVRTVDGALEYNPCSVIPNNVLQTLLEHATSFSELPMDSPAARFVTHVMQRTADTTDAFDSNYGNG